MDTNDSTTKVCSKCGVEYPLNSENFPPRKESPDGFRGVCKPCKSKRFKEKYSGDPEFRHRTNERNKQNHLRKMENPEYRKLILDRSRRADHPDDYEEFVEQREHYLAMKAQGLKLCGKCEQWLPATHEYFAKHKNRFDGLAVWCKKCQGSYSSERRTSNPELVEMSRQYGRDYHKDKMVNDPDYVARRRVQSKEYREEKKQDPEWIKARNEANKKRHQARKATGRLSASQTPEYQKAKWHERRANDPAFVQSERIRVQRRKSRRRSLPDNFSTAEWQHALDSWNGCAICGQQDGFWHMLVPDHWIPLSDERPDNPGTVPWNIIPLCHVRKGAGSHGSCNQSKAYHDPVIWLTEKLGKRAAKKKLAEIEAYFATVRK